MFFHHDIESKNILDEMENSGFASLTPAIDPRELRSVCESDPELLRYYEQMMTYCTRYAHDVFNMMYEQTKLAEFREQGLDTEEMYEELRTLDRNRKNLHDAMMGAVNLVSRELAKRGEDIEWMREVTAGGRASYAKFALLTFYKLYSIM